MWVERQYFSTTGKPVIDQWGYQQSGKDKRKAFKQVF
jgi:hypothetical protein